MPGADKTGITGGLRCSGIYEPCSVGAAPFCRNGGEVP
jgi:hypothetical protein